MEQKYPSILLERAVSAFSKLPSIGRKSGLRLALYLLRQEKELTEEICTALLALRNDIKYCTICHNISDSSKCSICNNPSRDHSTICVVATIKEVMAIEATQQYNGVYHVLGGIISPMDGLGPKDLAIDSLKERSKSEEVKEIILALSTTMEGDTTNYYIYRQLMDCDVKVSMIARGVSIGDELEYADEITLGSSIVRRTPFNETTT